MIRRGAPLLRRQIAPSLSWRADVLGTVVTRRAGAGNDPLDAGAILISIGESHLRSAVKGAD